MLFFVVSALSGCASILGINTGVPDDSDAAPLDDAMSSTADASPAPTGDQNAPDANSADADEAPDTTLTSVNDAGILPFDGASADENATVDAGADDASWPDAAIDNDGNMFDSLDAAVDVFADTVATVNDGGGD